MQTEGPAEVTGRAIYRTATLLPSVAITLPLLLALLSLWLAWLIVNFPVFADFLIATEAELNKVSWTTKSRLVQDTIVVLVTVFLLAVFLLASDITWYYVLKWTGVKHEAPPAQTTGEQEIPW